MSNTTSKIEIRVLLRIIAEALSEEGENHEYDRACVEISCEAMGLDMEEDTRLAVLALLRTIRDMDAPHGKPDEAVRIYRADAEPWDTSIDVARHLIDSRLLVGVDVDGPSLWLRRDDGERGRR